MVSVRLGALLAMRHGAGLGTPEDRERAHRLLSEVRDPATTVGAAATAEDRRWAALLLLMAKSPSATTTDFWSVFDHARQTGPDAGPAVIAEFLAPAEEAEDLPLPPEVRRELVQLRDALSHMARTDLSDPETLLDVLPEGIPFADELRTTLYAMADRPGTSPAQPTSPDSDSGADTTAETATDTAEAMEAESDQELAQLVGEPESLERATPADHSSRTVVLIALGNALTIHQGHPGPGRDWATRPRRARPPA
ncbi:hypothetical protein [Streptomyces sp. NPDC001816]|uniref:hypothetical protein n=1 Tax=Streptomyces sp. NPDC001816 TaxID=3364612 RepID=UPI0036983DF8